MFDLKIILAVAAVATSLLGNVLYFRGLYLGRTRPHAFSWLVWGILGAVVFAAQLSTSGGPGIWVTAVTVIISFVVFALALWLGDRKFVLLDWISLFGALFGLCLWWYTKDPVFSVLCVMIADFFGFLPTFRKGYNDPFGENVGTFSLASLKWIFSLLALENFIPTVYLYPVFLVVVNAVFVTMLLWRRWVLSRLLYTLIFIRHSDGRILLLYRKKPPYQDRWNGVGGKIEPGETIRQSAIREVQEETGFSVDDFSDVRFAGILTWNKNGSAGVPYRGAYAYVMNLKVGQEQKLLRDVPEGKTEWYPLDWISSEDNSTVVDNVPHVLRFFLSVNRPCWVHCEYQDEVLQKVSQQSLLTYFFYMLW